ncbi:MAG TPA: type II toxin-antitoxin system RelE/ParE family toxin [Verrucomicrobiota bacterium]|jgi:hypothetical protein|nr:type II toxin-antitoxin system RelE/ParE family toxin [Verrucomicrobiota bacterium]HRT08154.1 type II toxin-antitoxin system RelE/ParE family toxin [Candidatus Paceibacterota bacterium]HRT57652.1 type II toxin-antitoxin system RelE/ParE family toxin [Candidatus Paceibacterota bacterium]
MRLRILASARRDLDEGYRFYEAQAQGVGDYFLASVRADIESLRLLAGIHPIKHKDYHRMLCRAFPFAVFYTKTADEVTIYAVVDCRREPAWIRRRLQE